MQIVEHLLCFRQVVDMREAVFSFLVADAGSVHPTGEVFAAVNAHLNSQWQPGLQTNVHQPKLSINEVEVEK